MAAPSSTPSSSNIGILETAEDIQIRREQVLDRYDHFKQAANARRDKLLQAKSYAYFKFDADELESWIYEKLRIANEDLDKDITNVQNKLSRHEAFEAECTAHYSALDSLDQFGQKLIQNEHYASAKITDTLNHLHRLWDELSDALRSRHFKLKQLVRYVAWMQDVQEILYWIADKEAEIIKPSSESVARRENMSELEWIESERKRYDEVQKDLRVQEPKVLVLGARAEELIETSEGTLNNGEIRDKQRELNEAWNKLKNLAITKQESLYGAHEMQRFLRDIEETISWMDEKSSTLVQDPTTSSNSSSSQQDLNHIASLQRKHEAFERSLSTLGEKVEALEREGERLSRIPANENSVPVMNGKLDELKAKWSELLNNVDARKQRLEALRKLYQFLSDSSDLLAWYDDIAAVLGQDNNHVRDIESVELLIERNIEYKKDIESRDENLSRAITQGEELLDLVDDQEFVRDRLLKLKTNRAKLATLWTQKNSLLTERLKYLLFMRDADQLENWIRKQETYLSTANNGESLDDVELLSKKHADFEKSLSANEEKFRNFSVYAEELIIEENHMKNEIRAKQNEVQDRFERLKQAAESRGLNLAELYAYFTFERNCEEILSWIAEKIKLAQTKEYLDPANLQAKQQKHSSFESEIALQEPKVESLCATGDELIKEQPQQSAQIDSLVRSLKLQWNELLAATQLKGLRLKQAIDAQLFYRSLADLDLWLNESEHTVFSNDYGRDLPSTLMLKRRLADLEDEWITKLARVRELDQDLERMLNDGHFDSDHLRENGEVIRNRYYGLETPINERKARLHESLKTHEMRRDVGDEEQWIREKELSLSASRKQNTTDYTEVKKLVQKHQTFISELTGNESRVSETINRCQKLIEEFEAHEELEQPLEKLKSNWAALKENSEQRRVELDDALNLANYIAEAAEAEGWIREKEQIVSNEAGRSGKDEEATEAMLKRHSAVMIDIEAFGQNTVYGDLRNLASKCKDTEPQQPKKRDSALSQQGEDKREKVIVMYDYSAHGVTVRKGTILPLLSTSNNEWWKVELENGKRDYVPASYVKKIDQQQQQAQVKQPSPSGVALRQQQIEREYERLLALAQRRRAKLQDACDMHRLSRETAEIAQWLNIKQDITDDVLKAYEEDPNLSRESLETKLDSLKQDIRAKEHKIDELVKLAEKLKQNNQNEEAMKVYEEIERQKTSLEKFRRYVESLEVKLVKANELKKFKMDSEDTLEWINEKKQYLKDQNETDLENADLATVKRLQRKHDAFELDLEALGTRLKELDDRCDRLIKDHPEHGDELYNSQLNLQNNWNELVLLSTNRKGLLIDAFNYQSFLASYRDLKLWLETKIKQVAIDELAQDEASIDALIDRNQDHKNEIDARNETFEDFNRYGSDLINAAHPQAPSIASCLSELNEKRIELNEKWQAREKQLNQCLALIFFERDCQAAEKWMTVRENALSTPTRDDEAAIEDAFRKHEDLDRAISVQEAKIVRISYTADQLLGYEHYASEEISQRRDQVLARWERLKQALIESRADLDESLSVERFLHDAKEMIEWLDEKLDAVDELSNADLINTNDILRKQQKQELIDSEVASNAERAKYLISSGNKIIENKKCPGQEAEVRDHVNKIDSKWNELSDKSAQNLLRIKDGLRKRKFVASVQDMDFWLNQVESQLQSSDLGRDLTSVQSLLKKNQAIEADIAGHEEPLNELNNTDKNGNNEELLRPLNERFNAAKKACAHRKVQLTDANSLFQVSHELDDEEAWLREKLLSASSSDYGRDLPSTQNLRKRHRRLEAELSTHEPVIESLRESVSQLPLNEDDEALATLRLRCDELVKGWRELAALVESRGQRLDENLAYFKWLALIGEELAWLDDGAKLVVEPTPDGRERECGDTLPQAQGYMKKHEAFETDLGVHKERVDTLIKKGEELIQSGNFQKSKIEETNQNALKLVEVITRFSLLRKQRLHENLSRLHFYSRCEFVEMWIIQKEEVLRSSPSISSVHTLAGVKQLISRHEAFSKTLEVFENEGIRPLITLRDELNEAQSLEQDKPKIDERFQIVYARWRQLVGASEKRWRELREAEINMKSIDDLLLEFAKRAYELNSWFENAEEDLTDPVKCFSLEQIKDMFKSHDVFLASLNQVVQDLNEIKELDIRIRQVYHHPNPYTWHTVESLMDSWSVIQRANADREVDLEKERERQTDNDRLRKQYADAAKNFYRWVTETRVEMLDMGSSGTMSLEEQLRATNIKLEEIRDAQLRFQPVEELSTALEERLVMDNKYTEHTTLGLAQAWDQLDQLGLRMMNNLQQQIQALSQTGVTEDSLREFSHIFRHFDSTKSGRLSHDEFKLCLRALGYDLPLDDQRAIDIEFERILDIVDPQRLGYIGLQDYMSFLIRKETENISSMDDVVDAFKALTENGDKPYITRKELVTNLSPDQAEYCLRKMAPYRDHTGREIPDAYDYENFARALFKGKI